MPRRLDTRVVYIAGGSSGIGLAFARELLGRADTIVIFARDKQRLDGAVAQLTAGADARLAAGGRGRRCGQESTVTGISVDLAQPSQLRSALTRAVGAHGAPTLLVNSIGFAHPAPFAGFPQQRLTDMYQVNVMAVWNMLQFLLPQMGRGSTVINVGSFGALVGIFGYSGYASTKFALLGLTEVLRNEYKRHGIGMKLLCPTDTDTPQLHRENKIKPAETAAIAGIIKPHRPRFVAKYALRHAGGARFLLLPGLRARLIWLVRRIAPFVLFAYIDYRVYRIDRRGRRASGQSQQRSERRRADSLAG